jgi:hypothetical protein
VDLLATWYVFLSSFARLVASATVQRRPICSHATKPGALMRPISSSCRSCRQRWWVSCSGKFQTQPLTFATRERFGRSGAEKSDHRHCALLRACCEWPREHCAAEQVLKHRSSPSASFSPSPSARWVAATSTKIEFAPKFCDRCNQSLSQAGKARIIPSVFPTLACVAGGLCFAEINNAGAGSVVSDRGGDANDWLATGHEPANRV